jgi:hypothetical protein
VEEFPLETVDANVTPSVLAMLLSAVAKSLGPLMEYTGADPGAVENLSAPVKV